MLAFVLAGCAPQGLLIAPQGQVSFESYRRATTQWLKENRDYQTDKIDSEVAWNSPFELRPAGLPGKGILLIHGLGDSPWSFTDVGKKLAEQGFLVRTVLLPGHGTKPSDLLNVNVEDWRQTIAEQIAVLGQEVPKVYLGGFSTGANLALEYALDHPEIGGLVLFSPAFKSDSAFDWLLPWLAPLKPWLREPSSGTQQQTPVRYLNVPTNGFAQFYQSSATVRDKIARQPFERPALIILTQHDSVLDVDFVLDTFVRRFTNPESRLIWYGDSPSTPTTTTSSPRVLVRTDRLPEDRISQFSHMSVLFSPSNPLYGRQGSQPFCWNGQGAEDQQQCLAGSPVWYSDWGYKESGKIHARLTFNPYFDWQAEIMNEVISGSR